MQSVHVDDIVRLTGGGFSAGELHQILDLEIPGFGIHSCNSNA